MTTGFQITTRRTGPYFRRNHRREIGRLNDDMVKELVGLGMERLNRMLRPRPLGVYLSVLEAGRHTSKGTFRRSVHPTFRRNSAVIGSPVIYGPWLEGTGSRNQTTRFKGYAMFRRTQQWLDKQVRRVARSAVSKFTRRMGGSGI